MCIDKTARGIDSNTILNDVIVLACPETRENARSGGVMMQSDRVKKVVRALPRAVFVLFVFSWRGGRIERLVSKNRDHKSSSFPVPQTTPPAAKAGPVGVGRSGIQFMGSPPTPSFAIDPSVMGNSTLQPPITILTLVRFVRVPTRP